MSRINHSVMTGELYTRQLDANGHEILNEIPLEPPVGYKRTPSLAEQIKAMIRSERLREALDNPDAESFDEADDFDVEDDPIDPSTPYEAVFDPPPPPDPAPSAPPVVNPPEGPAEGGAGVDVPPAK